MPRHVELRNDPNATLPRECDQVTDLFLRVVKSVGTHLLQLGKFLTFDPESLIVREVQVEYVQLDRSHAVQIALQYVHRHVMPANIDQQPAPEKSRLILNR